MNRKMIFFLLLIAFTFYQSLVYASNRTALVIGNSNYQASPLKNPVNDAKDIAAKLEILGFDVVLRTDADKRSMVDGINLFARKLARSEVGIFYFAGHGIQINNINYLIPVNSKVESASDVEFEGINAGRILGKMKEAGNRLNIVVLDACRNNPFARSFRSASKGLAKMDAPPGSIIAYATSPGFLAEDGIGRNGVYTGELLKNLENPGLAVQEVFNQTGLGVMKQTNDKQVPWVSSTPVPKYFLARGITTVTTPIAKGSSKGKLSIISDPGGADIFIDQGFKGKAPLDIDSIDPGTYRVKARLKGYDAIEKKVKVNSNRKAVVTFYFEWEKTKGRLYVTTQPADCTIKILDITPKYVDGIKLDAGQYRIQVSKTDYITRIEPIRVSGGEGVDLYVELKKDSARTGQNWKDPVTGMEVVWVPEGCYQMGSSSGDPDEKPVHEVCVEGFWMGKYEVTQGQWKKIMSSNPSKFRSGDDYPVETISWNDAQQYISKLKQQSGNSFSLPTEAQWEYAARSGGRDQIYAGGNDVDSVAWYYSNSGSNTHRVGTKDPNGLGIYDMSGNVWEWCEDVYDKNAYSRHVRNNPVITSGGNSRVSRGGSWINNPRIVRAANRHGDSAVLRSSLMGFRLCLSRVRQ
jgi:formylglycine-generating enzyme required for sulfatase activity